MSTLQRDPTHEILEGLDHYNQTLTIYYNKIREAKTKSCRKFFEDVLDAPVYYGIHKVKSKYNNVEKLNSSYTKTIEESLQLVLPTHSFSRICIMAIGNGNTGQSQQIGNVQSELHNLQE